MKKIVRIFLSMFLLSAYLLNACLLSGCSSQPQSVYKAAKGSGFGYKEKSLGENRYRIEFKAATMNTKKAQDYALLRAAELTTEQGYDWFEVNKRDTFDNSIQDGDEKFSASELGARQQISRDCGLLGCRARVQTMPDVNADNDLTPFPEVTALVEISFGKGIRPAKQNIYDALETSETLQNKLLKNK